MTESAVTICARCHRGAEACQYCESVSREDWEAICDCGLYDFGLHLACDHDTAEAKR